MGIDDSQTQTRGRIRSTVVRPLGIHEPELMSCYPSSCSFPRRGVRSFQFYSQVRRIHLCILVIMLVMRISSNSLFSSALFVERHPIPPHRTVVPKPASDSDLDSFLAMDCIYRPLISFRRSSLPIRRAKSPYLQSWRP